VTVALAASAVLAGIVTGGADEAESVAEPGEPDLPDLPEVPGPDDPDPSAPPTPRGPPTEQELQETVEDISAFVEAERGREFLEPVEVELEDDAAFEARLLEDFEEEVGELEAQGVAYQALGLLEPGQDLAEELRSLLGAGVVGFYDPATAELVVRATALTPFTRTVIAHELVHALDDQHFELDRPDYDEADDEIAFGFSALVEGNAKTIEEAYFDAELTVAEQAEARREQIDFALDVQLPDLPIALLQVFDAPYVLGPDLVAALLEEGGGEALDAAFDRPPRTSEQVLDPDTYFTDEGAVAVDHPPPDGETVDEGVLGQLLIEAILAETTSQPQAEAAADGWGGDWIVVWRDQDQRGCLRATMVGDTAQDSDELHDAWSAWAGSDRVEATVDQSARGEPVTLTTCSR
jgi:hypothetical protein